MTEFLKLGNKVTEFWKLGDKVTELWKLVNNVTELWKLGNNVTEFLKLGNKVTEFRKLVNKVTEFNSFLNSSLHCGLKIIFNSDNLKYIKYRRQLYIYLTKYCLKNYIRAEPIMLDLDQGKNKFKTVFYLFKSFK